MNAEPAMCRAARSVTRLRPLVATLALLAAAPAAGAQTAGPPGLHWEGVAFDPERQRLVVFGGVTSAGTYLAETWAWDGRGWTTLAETASSPGPRHAHAMGYDATRHRVVLFGGAFESRDTTIPPARRERALCDVWWLEDATWTRAADADCPIDRTAAASLVSRAARGEMLLVEGPAAPGDTTPRRLRVWRRDGARWTLADSAGPRRSPIANGGVAFDERRGVLVVPMLAGPDSGVWEWNGARWRHVRAAGPAPRRNYAIAYDSRRERVVLIGGLAPSPRRPLADHWTWDGATWTETPSAGVAPAARSHATLLNDTRNGRLLYFGGAGAGGLQRELWIFDREGWRRWGDAPASTGRR